MDYVHVLTICKYGNAYIGLSRTHTESDCYRLEKVEIIWKVFITFSSSQSWKVSTLLKV